MRPPKTHDLLADDAPSPSGSSGSPHGQHRSGYYTRSRASVEYKAAGVLPVAIHNGEPLVLLGAEQVRTGPNGRVRKRLWRDFGGGREAIDIDAEATAGREFAEETLGIFSGCDVTPDCVASSALAMAAQLRQPGSSVHVVHPLRRGSSYLMYVTFVGYMDPLMLQLATQQNSALKRLEGAEKTAFAWVSLPQLLRCVATPRRRYRCPGTHSACSATARQASGRETCPLLLHPCFACSVRIMHASGSIDELLASAAAATAATSLVAIGPAVATPAPAAKKVGGETGGSTDASAGRTSGGGGGGGQAGEGDSMVNALIQASMGDGPAAIDLTPDHLLWWVSYVQQVTGEAGSAPLANTPASQVANATG